MTQKPQTLEKVKLTDEEWKKKLTSQEYKVLRQKGTDPSFSSSYLKFKKDSHKDGYYGCRGCGNPLYSVKSKFDSGCGWPAFDKCYKNSIKVEIDTSFGMRRIEIMCNRCDGHLGHVFEGEGFTKTNQRHCVNTSSIKYYKQNVSSEETSLNLNKY